MFAQLYSLILHLTPKKLRVIYTFIESLLVTILLSPWFHFFIQDFFLRMKFNLGIVGQHLYAPKPCCTSTVLFQCNTVELCHFLIYLKTLPFSSSHVVFENTVLNVVVN